METLLTFDFWSAQIAAAFEAWAILTLLMLAFWGVFKIKLARKRKELARTRKEMDGLKAYADDLDSRQKSARELNSAKSASLMQIRGQIDELRKLIHNDAERRVTAPRLMEVDEAASRLRMVNLITRGQLGSDASDKKRKLRLSGSDD